MKRVSCFLVLISFTPFAYCFPIAESSSVLSALLSVIASLIGGMYPGIKYYKKDSSKSFILNIVLFILLLIVSLSLFRVIFKSDEFTEFAIQSRPVLINEHLHKIRTSFDNQKYNFEDYKEYVNNNQILVDINDYYQNNLKDYKLINLDYKEGDIFNFPYNLSPLKLNVEKKEDLETLISLANKQKGKLLLVSVNSLKSFDISKKIYLSTGYAVPVSANYKFEHSNDLKDLLSKKGIEVNNIFESELIELRNLEEVIQAHTLENAKLLSVADLYNMTDKDIISYLSQFKSPIFVSYSEDDYVFAENRFKRINQNLPKYSYLKGGLKEHFNRGESLTPKYLNRGKYLSAEFAMEEYTKDANVRFICTERKYCSDNLPKEATYYFSYRELGRELAKEKIQNLSNQYRYILLSNNQETDGNSILTGYWLNKSGKTVVGILPISDFFSFEYVRHMIIKEDNISLSEYRKNYQEKFLNDLTLSFQLKSIIDQHGWLISFALLGVLFEIFLIKLLFNLYNFYYKHSHNPNSTKVILSSITVISTIVFMFYSLSSLITDYGVMSHKTIDILEQSEWKKWLAISFVLMSVYQSYISFPTSKINFYFASTLLVSIYLLGLIDGIIFPILVFLITSKITSTLVQLPFYLKFKKLNKLHQKGIYIEPFRDMPNLSSKWLLANNVQKTEGALFNIVKNDNSKYIKDYLQQKMQGHLKYIVRSCSSLSVENNLAGYYNSIICSFEQIQEKIDILRNQGLDFVWVQPYYSTIHNGVAKTLPPYYQDISLHIGQGDVATEGKKEVQSKIISRKEVKIFGKNEPGVDLLLKAEKIYKEPVQIEFGFDGNKSILYQVRLSNETDKKLFKSDLNKYILAESFLCKSTYLTGSILEYITNKDFLFVNGFLFEKLNRRYKKLWVKSNKLLEINKKLTEIEDRMLKDNLLPITYYYLIHDLLNEYKKIYKISQSFNFFINKNDINALNSIFNADYCPLNGEEMEISSLRKELSSITKFFNCNNKELSFRDYNHALIVKVSYLLHWSIKKYVSFVNISNPWDLKIENILSEDFILEAKAIYDQQPITQKMENNVIVPGKIKGKILYIDPKQTIEEILSDKNEPKYIFAGEEISSGWVKHLDRCSGIISIYGHSSSHLAISAKELNIPYIKVDKIPENDEVDI